MHSDVQASYAHISGEMNGEMRNKLHYEIHGLTSPDAPTIVFSSGLGGQLNFGSRNWVTLPKTTE